MLATTTVTLLLALLAPQGNELELTSGKIIKARKIKSETYKEVVYTTASGGESRKDAGEILEVRHDLGGTLLNDYAAGVAAMDEGNFAQAVSIFDVVLADERLLSRSTYAWVKQHTLFRKARSQFAMSDADGVVETVDRLLAEESETFFYAPALMLKAEILSIAGRSSEATSMFQQLDAEVTAKGLPERWAREAELGLALLDRSDDAKTRERKLAGLAEKNATKFPTVASRANVEIGNVMVQAQDYDKAQLFFERIVKSGQAEGNTLAAAYSGLGDCYWFRADAMEGNKDAKKAEYERAALNHLRVITMYKDAIKLVPRSHYYAARALRGMGEEKSSTQANQLANRLRRYYEESVWWERLKKDWSLR